MCRGSVRRRPRGGQTSDKRSGLWGDETVFCLFEGAEEDVRSVSEQAGVPFERVLASLRIDGKPQEEEG
jgi:hypothetical protein